MIVDDEEFCIAALKSIIQSAGINLEMVDFCIDGGEAVNMLEASYQNQITYCFIFIDFSMPVMNGLECTLQMRAYLTNEAKLKREEQPLIIGVTGHSNEEFFSQGISAGMDSVYSKPLYLKKFKAVL
jgi:CheY-like chemotaxis protein